MPKITNSQSKLNSMARIAQIDRAVLVALRDRGEPLTVPAFCAEWLRQSGRIDRFGSCK